MRCFFILMSALLFMGCGVKEPYQKVRDEKDKRLVAEDEERLVRERNLLLSEFLQNFSQTISNQWTYINSKFGDPFGEFQEARELCQSIGFDFPTVNMLLTDGASISGIANLTKNLFKDFENGHIAALENVVFTKGDKEQINRYIVCTRPVPLQNGAGSD